ncbi:MAG TPA: hypothetical protein VD833_12495 [Vicinamibacterales bacterium]|nr:hypothetical protein [Vicinamibacterales bacterium]
MRRPDTSGSPSAAQVARWLRRTARRLLLRDAVRIGAGLAVAAALLWITRGIVPGWARLAIVLGSGILASVLLYARRPALDRWSTRAAARAVERRAPESRNVVFTAAELIAHGDRAHAWIRERVFEDALRVSDAHAQSDLVPLRSTMALGVFGLLMAFALLWAPVPEPTSARPSARDAQESDDATFVIHGTITPPAYTGAAARSLVDPKEIEALQGSRLQLSVRARQGEWRVRFGSTDLPVASSGGELRVETTLKEPGYFAVEDGRGSRTRLIPLTLLPDHAPQIRVVTPGKDLLVPDASAAIAVSAEASDDYGLASVELRYTRVSGSGEQFQFAEGSVPLQVARHDPRSWSASGVLPLGRLGLEPGDALVYRIAARDARAGEAGLASSDTFMVEIAALGQPTLAGFELPPDRERYALSQQMIVLKIQRLRVREPRLARETLAEEAGGIAAEQRSVRANYVFLLGGHVEDEEEEAEHSHEIQEGRLQHSARRDIDLAIQHMSRTELALATVSTASALAHARAAVQALQRAFGRSRYILRSLAVRSRLDPSRRLVGELDRASSWQRDRLEPETDARAAAARRMREDLLRLLPEIGSRRPPASEMSRLAEDALRTAPGDVNWQRLSALLQQLAAPDGPAEITRTLADALSLLTEEAGRGTAPAVEPDVGEGGLLRSAWADGGPG